MTMNHTCDVRRPGLLRRIDIEARTLTEIVGLVVGHALARGDVSGKNQRQPLLAACRCRPALIMAFSCVHVRPERYHNNGTNASAPAGGM